MAKNIGQYMGIAGSAIGGIIGGIYGGPLGAQAGSMAGGMEGQNIGDVIEKKKPLIYAFLPADMRRSVGGSEPFTVAEINRGYRKL